MGDGDGGFYEADTTFGALVELSGILILLFGAYLMIFHDPGVILFGVIIVLGRLIIKAGELS